MTPFRDDRDALVARNDALQRELDAARRRLAELDAHEEPARLRPRLQLVRRPETRARLGRYARIYEIDAEISKERFVEMLRAIEELTEGPGSDENAHCIAWYGRRCSIKLVAMDGRSKLTCTETQEGDSRPALLLVSWIAAASVATLSWPGVMVALIAAVLGYLTVASDRRCRERAWQRFDGIAALLDVALPGLPALPARAALAAGDERAR